MIDKVFHPHDVWIDTWNDIEERWGRGKDLSIECLPDLNHKIWGLKKKNLVVVGGRPAQGKSSFMLQLAWDFAQQGKKCYFFTLEMTKEKCVERLFSNDQEIDNFLIYSGKIGNMVDIPQYEDKIKAFNDRIKTNNLILVESYGRSFEEINDVISKFGDADAVFIDYLQLIRARNKNAKDDIDEYIKELRAFAIENDFCAIVGSQINRGTHDQHKTREPEMYELKGSGAIEEHCDLCFLVHWEYYYTRDDEKKNDYLINIAKNRDGRTGKMKCKYIPQFTRVEQL